MAPRPAPPLGQPWCGAPCPSSSSSSSRPPAPLLPSLFLAQRAGSRAPLHGEQQAGAPAPSSSALKLLPGVHGAGVSPARPSPPLCFPVRAQSFHGRRPKLQPFPAPCWRAAQQLTHGWRPENSSRLPSSSSPISSSSQQAIPSAVQSATSFSRPCQQHAMAGSAPSMGVPCYSLRPALSIQHAPFSSMEKPAASPLLAVLRGARRLFEKLCSKPHAAGSLFGGAIGQHAVMPP
ncbi:predicted GPI-anchored protein 58 [Zea mays]|uniref:predicted GPI-anchored protein 58 n=1 Tax=Zea mays TaxID=4577 RepID=UPI0004DEBD3D|nr:predicted GPI-anchored protein 58 [Zea mays]